jgi:hypothetical protein
MLHSCCSVDLVATQVYRYCYVCQLIIRYCRTRSSQTPHCRVRPTNYIRQFNDAKPLRGTRKLLSQVFDTFIGFHSKIRHRRSAFASGVQTVLLLSLGHFRPQSTAEDHSTKTDGQKPFEIVLILKYLEKTVTMYP